MALEMIILAVNLRCYPCSAFSQVTCLHDHLNKSMCDRLELPEVWYYQKAWWQCSDTGRAESLD